MKRLYRRSVLIMLASLTLLVSISYVSAMPIGPALPPQGNPFESLATAVETGSRVDDPTGVTHDGDLESSITFDIGVTGYFGLTGFMRPTDIGWSPEFEFDIGWIDIKIKYSAPATSDDKYRFEYFVGDSGPVVLAPDVSGTDAYAPIGSWEQMMGRAWHNVDNPRTPGVWTWDDLKDIRVRVVTTVVGWKDWGKTFRLFEIWLTVYEPPLPPSASTAISIQPKVVDNAVVMPGMPFFIDVYVKDILALQSYELRIDYNTTILTPLEARTYFPWASLFAMDIMDPEGYVHIGFFIPIDSPIVDYGFDGSSPILRIYFVVEAPGESVLDLRDTILVAPGAVTIDHAVYDGVYGPKPKPEFPLGVGLMMALAPAIPIVYLLRTRKKVRKE